MTQNNPQPAHQRGISHAIKSILISGLALFALVAFLVIGLILLLTPAGSWLSSNMNWLFATDSLQIWWYVTRSAGIIAYLLLWLSTIWGLAVPSRIISPVLDQSYTFDFHQFISLLSIAFMLLHVIVLSFDYYMPYSIWQILVPFLSPYRPLWVGIGVVSFYIILLVTITFYLRTKIGMRAFRAIHILSLLSYLGVTLHGLYSGTDAPLLSMQLLYRGTGLVIIFLTVYWLTIKVQQNMATKNKLAPPLPPSSQTAGVPQPRKMH